MPQFDAFATELQETLPVELATTIIAAPMQSLREGPMSQDLARWLADPSAIDSLAAIAGRSSDELQSALWLAAGDLDRSHTISQNIESMFVVEFSYDRVLITF